MSEDGRYMYNSPSQAMATSYEYSAYQTPAYDTAQIPQQHPHNTQQQAPSSSRQSTNMRVNSPAGHHSQPPPHTHSQYYAAPPPQPQAPQPQTSYPPPQAYSAPAHQPGMPPTGPGQWPADNWGHYSTSYGPPPIPDEAPTYSSGPARSEHPQPAAPPSQPVSQAQSHPSHQIHSQAEQGRNSYVSGGPSPVPELRRAVPVPEERYSNPSSVPSPVPAPATKLSRRKDKEPHISMSPSIPSPPALDFTKLYESYQMMIDTSSSVVHATLPPPATAEAMDRMMRAATYGSHMLDTAVQQQQNQHQQPHQQQQQQQQQRAPQSNSPKRQPPQAQVEATKPPESETKPVLPNPKKTEEDGGTQEGQTCLGCNATSTPEWRRGPLGPRTLCNACGLVYAKLIKKRQRDSGRKKGKNPSGSAAAGGDESSDDSEHSSGRAGSEVDQKQNMRE
ncbi:hypothetical protein FIBSPDRAFT_945854 [Athelia psychrophila]|uniref:GATA-type domain-containing protein n=1 Tax=Athelia psychrophila TaxID=1759441 RepID=A0A166TD53_9AGAM|nr:hypothetical protein FIBSPDRAFT_945854 [Fibularhizoctonia sp. CBS 109695]